MHVKLRRTLSKSRVYIFVASLLALVLAVTAIFGIGEFFNSSASTLTGAKGNLVPSITATLNDSYPDPDMDGKAAPDEVVTYTATINNAGTVATGVQFTDTLDVPATLVAGSLHASPVAVNDSYIAVGNTLLEVGVAPSGFPAVKVAGSVLSNDATLTDTTSVVSNTNPASGTVSVNANGTFSYLPNANFTGPDTFTYTIRNNADPTLTDTATVTITVANKVWYVNNSGANGTGRSNSPFNNLTSANAASSAGDIIFVHRTGTNYSTGITLKNNQELIGQGINLVVGGFTLETATSNPVISPGSANGITLASGNTVRGLTIGNTGSGIGISGSSVGSLTISNTTINGTGEAIDTNTGSLSVTFDSVSSSNSSGQGIDLNGVSGSFQVTGGTTVTNPASTGVDITNSGAGTFTFSSLDITTTNNTGLLASAAGTVNTSSGTISTGSGIAVDIDNTVLGITLTSVSSVGGVNPGIDLASTSGTFTIAGTGGTCATGTPTCTGGRIANKTGDAVTLSSTSGRVTLTSLLIEDIGNMGGGFNTRSQHDAIHGETVNGGLTLNNTLIRRISDMCINGATFGGATPGLGVTVWNGLDILNSTIEDCNRWHVAGTGDTSDEGGVRILGLTGSVTIDDSRVRRAGELFDLFTHTSGTLTINVTDNLFEDAFKEFTSGGTVAIGKSCFDVTVEGNSNANVTIGVPTVGFSNTFINCGTSSLRVSKDTTPAGSSNIDVIVQNNSFRVTDQTSANDIFGNTPQGGVALRAGPGGITTFDALVQNNVFGVAVGPDDDVGSTTDEVANADGVEGNVALIFESGNSKARVNNNTFNGPINAPWFNRADGNSSAAVLYRDNTYRGRGDYCCDPPPAGTFRVPGIPSRTRVRNGGSMDITFENDIMAVHDQFFFPNTETMEFVSQNLGGGGTMCVALDNVTSPDGIEFEEAAGTINLFQGAVNNPANGPCGVGSSGDCQNELADDGVRGGPVGYNQSGAPNAALNPPFVDVDAGSISIIGAACTTPSGFPFFAEPQFSGLGGGVHTTTPDQSSFMPMSLLTGNSESKLRTADTFERDKNMAQFMTGLSDYHLNLLDGQKDRSFKKTAIQIYEAGDQKVTEPGISLSKRISDYSQSIWNFVSSVGSMIFPSVSAQERVGKSDGNPVNNFGETVTVGPFDLPAGKSVTIVFRATIAHFNGSPQMSTQGSVSGTNFATVPTDDPATAAALDPTVTPLALAPTAAGVTVSGRAVSKSGRGLENVRVVLSGGDLTEPLYSQTNAFGYYRFADIPAGQTYVITVSSKRYEFASPSRLVNVEEDVVIPVFIGQ